MHASKLNFSMQFIYYIKPILMLPHSQLLLSSASASDAAHFSPVRKCLHRRLVLLANGRSRVQNYEIVKQLGRGATAACSSTSRRTASSS